MIELNKSALVRLRLPDQEVGLALAILTKQSPVAKSQSPCRGICHEFAEVINLN